MDINSIILEVENTDLIEPTERFYRNALQLGQRVKVAANAAPSTGFRGFAPSLTFAQPADVDALYARAIEAGAEELKPVAKTVWGYGGSLRAPDGTVWQVSSESKKNTAAATGELTSLVLLLGVADVKASKKFYEQNGAEVEKSFGGTYAQFRTGAVTLALYKRAGLAKQVGVSDATGGGSHRVIAVGDTALTDPDGYVFAD